MNAVLESVSAQLEELRPYAAPTEDEKKSEFIRRVLLSWWLPMSFYRVTLNFLVTSNAELRVFWPILKQIAHHSELKANVIYLNGFAYSSARELEFKDHSRITFGRSIFPLVSSFEQPARYANIICLDHVMFAEHHALGIKVVNALQKNGAKCVCLQHGSMRWDNVEGHVSSASSFQVVWGSYIHEALVKLGRNLEKLFLTGNPLHDELTSIDESLLSKRFRNFLAENKKDLGKRKIILVATCLQAEYDDRENSEQLYRKYISSIYESFDPSAQFLVVKMHPNDSEQRNLYREELSKNLEPHVEIFSPSSASFSIYELIALASVVITRASTIAEEGLLLGKCVIAFDFFKDGPISKLSILSDVPGYLPVIGDIGDLSAVIKSATCSSSKNSVADGDFVHKAGFRLDGCSASRVVDVLVSIARGGKK